MALTIQKAATESALLTLPLATDALIAIEIFHERPELCMVHRFREDRVG